MMRIGITFTLPIEIFREDEWYVANCPALNVASQGDTPEEAKAHLGEALLAFLESCLDHGTLEAVLQDCGFSPVPTDNFNVVTVEPPEDTIDVPLYLLAKFAGSGQCHHA